MTTHPVEVSLPPQIPKTLASAKPKKLFARLIEDFVEEKTISGGPPGYEGLLDTLFDPDDPEQDDTVTWADYMKGGKFEPEEFVPSKVKFTKPGWRLRKLLDSM